MTVSSFWTVRAVLCGSGSSVNSIVAVLRSSTVPPVRRAKISRLSTCADVSGGNAEATNQLLQLGHARVEPLGRRGEAQTTRELRQGERDVGVGQLADLERIEAREAARHEAKVAVLRNQRHPDPSKRTLVSVSTFFCAVSLNLVRSRRVKALTRSA